jgi:hypothetical protein
MSIQGFSVDQFTSVQKCINVNSNTVIFFFFLAYINRNVNSASNTVQVNYIEIRHKVNNIYYLVCRISVLLLQILHAEMCG